MGDTKEKSTNRSLSQSVIARRLFPNLARGHCKTGLTRLLRDEAHFNDDVDGKESGNRRAERKKDHKYNRWMKVSGDCEANATESPKNSVANVNPLRLIKV